MLRFAYSEEIIPPWKARLEMPGPIAPGGACRGSARCLLLRPLPQHRGCPAPGEKPGNSPPPRAGWQGARLTL